jgi:hypothetical protein
MTTVNPFSSLTETEILCTIGDHNPGGIMAAYTVFQSLSKERFCNFAWECQKLGITGGKLHYCYKYMFNFNPTLMVVKIIAHDKEMLAQLAAYENAAKASSLAGAP